MHPLRLLRGVGMCLWWKNTAPGFHPCHLIIEKSLNSCLHFSGCFPEEDRFPTKLLTPNNQLADRCCSGRAGNDMDTDYLENMRQMKKKWDDGDDAIKRKIVKSRYYCDLSSKELLCGFLHQKLLFKFPLSDFSFYLELKKLIPCMSFLYTVVFCQILYLSFYTTHILVLSYYS